MLRETILNDDFLAQHSVATLLRHCFEWLQHCSDIATLCCAKNRRCESSRVTSPLVYKFCRWMTEIRMWNSFAYESFMRNSSLYFLNCWFSQFTLKLLAKKKQRQKTKTKTTTTTKKNTHTQNDHRTVIAEICIIWNMVLSGLKTTLNKLLSIRMESNH